MTTYQSIRHAFEDALEAIAGIDDTNAAFENVAFNPDGKSTWVRCRLQASSQRQAAMGVDAARRDDGLFLVEVFGLQNVGPSAVDVLVDGIIAAFKAGTKLTQDGLNVHIQYAERSAGLNDAPWYYVPVTIAWYSYINE